MSIKLTEERLRTYLIDQASQERMCIAILSLDERFTNVRPRRPKGGPDGKRDIEASYNGAEVWGGVGFKRNATDSSEDKKWLQDKFLSDAKSAKAAHPDLRSFVFFTNLDVTPKEYDDLIEDAKKLQFVFVEIFYRERLRITLDSPEGLGLRFQYLDMKLSEAEQSAFFAKWEKGLETLLLKNFTNIDQKLERLEFINQLNRGIDRIHFIIQLKEAYSAEQLGNYKFLAEIEKDSSQRFFLGGLNSNVEMVEGEKRTSMIGIHEFNWVDDEDKPRFNCSVGMKAMTNLLGSHGLVSGVNPPFITMNDLHSAFMNVYVTDGIYDKIHGVWLIANNYVVTGSQKPRLMLREGEPYDTENFPKEFLGSNHELILKTVSIPEGMLWKNFRIDFTYDIPKRVPEEATWWLRKMV